MDDGAYDIDESLELCRMADRNGIDKIVATPHFVKCKDVDGFLEFRNNKIADLQELLTDRNIYIKIYGGAEVYVSSLIEDFPDLKKLTINNGRYLLCEFKNPNYTEKKIEHYLNIIRENELIPVIAHAELINAVQQDILFAKRIKSKFGAKIQVNLSDLIGFIRYKHRKTADMLLERNLADVLATDSHDPIKRNNNVEFFLDRFRVKLSSEQKERLLEENPQKIVDDIDF